MSFRAGSDFERIHFVRCWLAALVAVPSVSTLPWNVSWSDRAVQVTAVPGTDTAMGTFTVFNTGKEPVIISNVQPDCECVKAESNHDIVPPGGSAIITASLIVGDRIGVYHNLIQVYFDGAAEPGATLSLEVAIHPPIVAQPRVLYWRRGQPWNKKSLMVFAAGRMGIRSIMIDANSSLQSIGVVELVKGRRYLVDLAPKPTPLPMTISVTGRVLLSNEICVAIGAFVKIQ